MAIPLVIGLLVGSVVRRTIKLVLGIIGLVGLLSAMGYVSFSVTDLYDKAMEYLPSLITTGQGALDVLPYSSGMFIVGLSLGLWRG